MVRARSYCYLALGLALALTYHFSPYSARGRMERGALVCMNTIRSPEWLPPLLRAPLDWVHDCIPNSEGLVVDAGELSPDDTVWLAGTPTARSPLRTLTNHSSRNRFHTQYRQSACLAARLTDTADREASPAKVFYDDPRVPGLTASQLTHGPWQAEPLIAPAALARQFGPSGANEAHLVSQLVPMHPDLAAGSWRKLQQLLAVDYPPSASARSVSTPSDLRSLADSTTARRHPGSAWLLRNRLARDRCRRPACHRLSPAEYRQRPSAARPSSFDGRH